MENAEQVTRIESRHPDGLEDRVVETLQSIFDPEIPVNIYDIGLIYEIDVAEDGVVDIKMTLTSPMCPVAESLPPEVENKVAEIDGVTSSTVEVVWEPAWNMEMMNEAAKLQLGLM